MNVSREKQDLEQIVNHKVSRRVAKKVMQDIHHQVDDIEQQVHSEISSKKFVLPVIVLILMAAILLSSWPFILRLFSSISGAG